VSSQLPDSLVQPLVHILVLAGLLHLTGLSPNSALVGLMISVVVACLVGWYLLWKVVHSRWQTRALPFDLRGLFSAWIPFSALAGVLIVYEQVTTVLLGILGTESDVAHLRIAERGAQLVALPLVVVNTVVGPHLARAFHDRAPHLAQLVAVRSAWLALCLAAPLTIVLVVWGDSILDVVYGVEYAEAGYWPLAILTAGQLAVTMFGPVGALLNMAGHERESLRGLVLGLITNVVACYVLIPPWGDVGAAWAIVCSLVVWNLVLSIQLFRRTRVHSSPVAAAIARKGATWWDAESNDERPR
jgi:O-antigen/teichoic acid export membrane protein